MTRLRGMIVWVKNHPARASAISGWFQQLCGIVGALLTIPPIINVLGAEAAGLWFSLQGLIIVFTLADFGFSMAISRQVSHSLRLDLTAPRLASDLFDTSPAWQGVSELWGASRLVFLRASLVAAILMVVVFECVLPWTHFLPARTAGTAASCYLLGGALVILIYSRLPQAFLDGLGYSYASRFIAGAYQLGWNLLTLVALYLAPGFVSLGVAFLISTIAQAWVLQFVLRRVERGRLNYLHVADRVMVRRLWKTAVPFGFVNSGSYLTGAIQLPLLASLLGPAVVAPYYIAQRLTQMLSSTVGQITNAQMPFFTQELAAGHLPAARRRMQQTILLGIGINTAGALGLWLLSPWVVALWVGPGKYVDAPVLAAMAANHWLVCLAGVAAPLVLAAGRNPFAGTTLLHGVLSVGGMFLFCPRLGVLGVPLASIVAGLFTNFWFVPLHGWRVWGELKCAGQGAASS